MIFGAHLALTIVMDWQRFWVITLLNASLFGKAHVWHNLY